jgi:Mn2+/Fe2+ NRAMP family transporter
VGFQMVGVAVAWQLYELTGSTLDLGLVGLVQFVPMILLTSRRKVMGNLVNNRSTTAIASIVALIIIALNLFLLQQQFFG